MAEPWLLILIGGAQIRERVHVRPACSNASATGLLGRIAPQAACTLVKDAFRQSTDRRPASIALIVQRRAASQNCCLCSVQQNF